MNKSGLSAIILAILFVFSPSILAQSQEEAKVALLEKIEGKPSKKAKVRVERPKSALELQCEDFAPDKKAVCLKAQSDELAKLAKEAEKTSLKSEPDSMSDVREAEHKAEKKARKAREYLEGLYNRVDIQGCDPRTVEVYYQASVEPEGRVGASVQVRNSSPYPVMSITRPRYGKIVGNLCSNGGMTLYFEIQWNEGNYVNFPLTATTITPDGVTMIATFNVSLSRYSAPQTMVQELVWVIDPQRVNQNR